MYQLRITIEGINPPIWRLVQVSENYSFYKLHHIIQKIFGWTNSHIWCFLHEGVDAPITNPWLWGGGTTKMTVILSCWNGLEPSMTLKPLISQPSTET